MKPVGATQRKAKKGNDRSGRPINHTLKAFRKWKNIEKDRRAAETARYNELCGPVTITYKEII